MLGLSKCKGSSSAWVAPAQGMLLGYQTSLETISCKETRLHSSEDWKPWVAFLQVTCTGCQCIQLANIRVFVRVKCVQDQLQLLWPPLGLKRISETYHFCEEEYRSKNKSSFNLLGSYHLIKLLNGRLKYGDYGNWGHLIQIERFIRGNRFNRFLDFLFSLEGLFLIWIYFKKMNRLKEALNCFFI